MYNERLFRKEHCHDCGCYIKTHDEKKICFIYYDFWCHYKWLIKQLKAIRVENRRLKRGAK